MDFYEQNGDKLVIEMSDTEWKWIERLLDNNAEVKKRWKKDAHKEVVFNGVRFKHFQFDICALKIMDELMEDNPYVEMSWHVSSFIERLKKKESVTLNNET